MYSHYEFIVAPFGMSIALVVFMCLMNGIFKKYLNNFFIIFLDDILIYSISEHEHDQHLRMVLEVLREHKIYAKMNKCSFYQRHIHYLGHITLEEGIVVDPDKIKAIREFQIPRNVIEVR
jgi:hypothetical protein